MPAPSDPDGLADQCAGLAALEAAIMFAARAVRHAYPTVDKVERPQEPREIATARDLVDQCEGFLAALAAHRNSIATSLPDRPDNRDVSF